MRYGEITSIVKYLTDNLSDTFDMKDIDNNDSGDKGGAGGEDG